MWKKAAKYSVMGVVTVALALAVAGVVVKKGNEGRVAPGVVLCGKDVSGMTREELERTVSEFVPETVTELRCRFLPEMRREIEARVRAFSDEEYRMEGKVSEGDGRHGRAELSMEVSGNELCLTTGAPMFRVDTEATVEAVMNASGEATVWEWLYGALTGQAVRKRSVDDVFLWDEACFGAGVEVLREIVERESQEATVHWEGGKIKVTESRRGYRLDGERLQTEVERVKAESVKYLQKGPAEVLVLRFYVGCTVSVPELSTEQAKACNTVIGEFVTSYAGAGAGRAQNIKAGAEKLHDKVILPGEEFSVAAALMPFTEANGYASGGTYIDGQLGESVGGGVCQLSTTLYNALLYTKLDITMRYPHSLPVGYIPLGRDAAIAGDYKDLRFVNNTEAPVLLLCEADGKTVKVTLYGTEEVKREAVTFESVVTEQTEEDISGKITVEVYRTEKGEEGKEVREKVSRDRYKEGE